MYLKIFLQLKSLAYHIFEKFCNFKKPRDVDRGIYADDFSFGFLLPLQQHLQSSLPDFGNQIVYKKVWGAKLTKTQII
jgi:hypothetical protein